MQIKTFSQILYVGEQPKKQLPDLDLIDVELGKACMAYAESHVAEPQAQFRDYILKDPTTIVTMGNGITPTYLAGTRIAPQTTKHMCQGVGGHLGEGATAVAVETTLGLPGRITHTAVRKGRQRAPDFVVVATLNELVAGPYSQAVYDWEIPMADVRLPFPVEAKARRDAVTRIRPLLEDGALQQIIAYWWAMSRSGGCKPVIGYGLVMAFCHQDESMVHCVLRPKSQQARLDLVDMLELGCPTKLELASVMDDDDGRADVLALLEGF